MPMGESAREDPRAQKSARLAEMLGGLSLACDLADGFPPEKVLRTVVLAVELGKRAGLSGDALREVYYTTLLRYVGCTAFAHEEAHIYGAGDDINTRSVMALADGGRPLDVVSRIARGIGREGGLRERARAGATRRGTPSVVAQHARSQCEASMRMASAMGLDAAIHTALGQICERYDGKGAPHGTPGEALALSIRLSHVADIAEIAYHRDGRAAALAIVKERSGTQFDPKLARIFIRDEGELLDAIEGPSVWERYLELEPAPHALLDAAKLDTVARAFADFADVKSTYTLGHSRGVAELAVRAAVAMGLPEAERETLKHAALLHDLGRVAVPNGVWDKPGKLSVSDWERVRLHAYYTERVVWRCPPLRAAAHIAAADHERLDGAGYHRAIAGTSVPRAARILAAADSFQAMTEPRPHRPALARDAIEKEMLAEVGSGRLDREAVNAVLDLGGHRTRAGATWPSGLTDREVEVLRRLARGCSNKQIGAELSISARTVQHHVMHIYDKVGCSSRAAAALFATEHRLLDPS